MGAKPATAEKNGVILIRMGIGREEYVMPEGATLADLLQMARAQTEDQAIFIDGKPLEESVVLQPGMIVSIVPRPENSAGEEPWRKTMGMFQDDPTFQDFVDRVKARRDRERGKS